MQIQQGTFCPLIKKDCIQNKCKFFVKLLGNNPQTGNPVEEWDCAVYWLPVLLIENAKETRQGAAAIESFRNEAIKIRANNAALPIGCQHIWESYRQIGNGEYSSRCTKCGVVNN